MNKKARSFGMMLFMIFVIIFMFILAFMTAPNENKATGMISWAKDGPDKQTEVTKEDIKSMRISSAKKVGRTDYYNVEFNGQKGVMFKSDGNYYITQVEKFPSNEEYPNLKLSASRLDLDGGAFFGLFDRPVTYGDLSSALTRVSGTIESSGSDSSASTPAASTPAAPAASTPAADDAETYILNPDQKKLIKIGTFTDSGGKETGYTLDEQKVYEKGEKYYRYDADSNEMVQITQGTITKKDGDVTETVDVGTGVVTTEKKSTVNNQKITTTTTKFPDGITVVSENKGSDTSAYIQSADGNKVNLDNEAYKRIVDDADTARLAKELVASGMTSVKLEDGSFTDGKVIVKRQDDNIITTDGDGNLLRLSTGTSTTKFEGKVTYKKVLGYELNPGATAKTYNGQNQLISMEEVSSDGKTKTYIKYSENDITITDYNYDSTDDEWDESSVIKLIAGTGPNSGAYQVEKIGISNLYFDPGGLFGSSGEFFIIDGDGNRRELTDEELDRLEKKFPDLADKITKADDAKRESDGRPTASQEKTQDFFQAADYILSDFSGLGYFGTLFMGDDALLEWQTQVDKLFSTLMLGTDYWTSKLCSANIEQGENGIGYVDTGTGLASVGAHIQATRSEPVTNPKNQTTEYLYKITFSVKNGEHDADRRALEEMSFDIVLYGERTATLYNNKKISRGDSFSRGRSDPVLQYSSYRYDKICIEFDEVPFSWLIDGNKVCNDIVTVTEATTPYPESSTGSQDSDGGSSGEEQQI